MQTLLYYMVLAFVKLLGYLPMGVLYGFSELTYGILYHVIRYRRKVVCDNLLRVFPDKTEAERNQIARKFYHALSDLIVEIIKMFSASDEEMQRRIHFAHPEIWEEMYQRRKMALIVTSHYGNWEWLASMCHTVSYPFISLYHVLRNPVFERLILHLRTRFGTQMISMKHFYRTLLDKQMHDLPTAFCFITDQAPKKQNDQEWFTFLHQPTHVYVGMEKLARKYNCAVIYLSIRRIRRGYYTVEDTLITADGASTAPGYLTQQNLKLLEKDILRAPEFWLWSHKRWKHTPPMVKETDSACLP